MKMVRVFCFLACICGFCRVCWLHSDMSFLLLSSLNSSYTDLEYEDAIRRNPYLTRNWYKLSIRLHPSMHEMD